MQTKAPSPHNPAQGHSRTQAPPKQGGDLQLRLPLRGPTPGRPRRATSWERRDRDLANATPLRPSAAASFSRPGVPPITVRVVEDTHTYATSDGSTWWAGGHTPIYEDEDGEHYFIGLGEYLPDSRLLYCKIAGARHYPALYESRFKPGSIGLLRPEPENAYDANAVAVWDGEGSVQVGYIPAVLSGDIASRIRAGEKLVVFVLREIRRQSQSGQRAAFHVLVMPDQELNLSVAQGTPPRANEPSQAVRSVVTAINPERQP
jgi:hypothetical protein